MPDHAPDLRESVDSSFHEAACIHTRKIYDSCQAKDCVEDLRFYPTESSQTVLDSALSLRSGRAEPLYVYLNVQPIGLGRGFFTIDMRFYYRVTIDTAASCTSTVPITGLAVYDKRCVLFGSEGSVRTFSSELACETLEGTTLPAYNSLPTAVIETVDPLILSMRIAEPGEEPSGGDLPAGDIPPAILSAFDEPLVFGDVNTRRIYLALGQFSILRLERDAGIRIPIYDYCMPDKECCCGESVDDPCELFQQVQFPVVDFFPPVSAADVDPMERIRKGCCFRSNS